MTSGTGPTGRRRNRPSNLELDDCSPERLAAEVRSLRDLVVMAWEDRSAPLDELEAALVEAEVVQVLCDLPCSRRPNGG